VRDAVDERDRDDERAEEREGDGVRAAAPEDLRLPAQLREGCVI
jgi:hypothetical protein